MATKTPVATKPATTKPATTKPATRVAKVVAKATGRAKIATKICRVCGANKPLSDYRVKSSRPDGRDSICTEDARLWLANRKAILASAKPATKRATKPVATKPATKRATKPAASAKPALPAREAAARARDAKSRVAK